MPRIATCRSANCVYNDGEGACRLSQAVTLDEKGICERREEKA